MHLELAAYGWEGSEWDSFYPDDLPSEWRLDYYANTYDAIVVPASAWQSATIDEAKEWLAEAPAGFRFYWELADAAGAARLLELLPLVENTAGQVAAWLFRSGLKLEHRLFNILATQRPGGTYGEAPLPAVQTEQLAAEGITLCWQDGVQLNCRGNGLRILQLTTMPELRDLRQLADAQQTAGANRLLLLLKPGAVTPAQMHDLLTLTNLING